jgi:hypothetical protein
MTGQIGSDAVEEILSGARVALTNVRLAEIATAVSLMGFEEEQFLEGDALFNTLDEAVRIQAKEYGEQYASTEEFNSLWALGKKSSKTSLKIARIVFADDTASQVELELNGKRKRSFSGWYIQVRKLYLGMTDARIKKMGRFGINKNRIGKELQAVEAIATANAAQAKERGEAQEATKARDLALDNLDDWLDVFYKIARIALEDMPQAREKLGLLERS